LAQPSRAEGYQSKPNECRVPRAGNVGNAFVYLFSPYWQFHLKCWRLRSNWSDDLDGSTALDKLMSTNEEFYRLVLQCPFTDVEVRVQRALDRINPPLPTRVESIPSFMPPSHEDQRFPLRPVASAQREPSILTASTSVDSFNINPFDLLLMDSGDLQHWNFGENATLSGGQETDGVESNPAENDHMDSGSSAPLAFTR
jgi:hypothetical protein